MSGSQRGIVVQSDDSGKILKVLHNNLNLDRNLQVSDSWLDLLDSDSLEKAGSFLKQIRTSGAAFNWELNIQFAEEILSFRFAGILIEDGVLVFAAKTNGILTELLHGFSEIGDEQANTIRSALKENSLLRRQIESEVYQFDEVSKLNNELVNLQRELNKKNAQLAELNSQKNSFLGIAAHDLRNPLNNISYLADFIRDETATLQNSDVDLYIEHIKTQSSYMHQLVEDFLDVSTIEEGKIILNKTAVDIVGLVSSCILLNTKLAQEKNIRVHFNPEVERLVLRADELKMRQVLNNLLSNAVKYSHPESEVRISLARTGAGIVIIVADEGIGIEEERLEQIFAPFSLSKSRGTAGEKSTGLGLYIVKRIVTAHGGSIDAESTPGKGSRFRVVLPEEE